MTEHQARFVLSIVEWLWSRHGESRGMPIDHNYIVVPKWSIYGDPRYSERTSVTVSSRTIAALYKLDILQYVGNGRVTLSANGWRLVPEAYAMIWWSDWINAWANIAARHEAVTAKRRARKAHADWWPEAWAAAWARIGAYYAADSAHPMPKQPKAAIMHMVRYGRINHVA